MFVESGLLRIITNIFSVRLEFKNLKELFWLTGEKKKTLQKYIVYGIFGFIYFSQIVS